MMIGCPKIDRTPRQRLCIRLNCTYNNESVISVTRTWHTVGVIIKSTSAQRFLFIRNLSDCYWVINASQNFINIYLSHASIWLLEFYFSFNHFSLLHGRNQTFWLLIHWIAHCKSWKLSMMISVLCLFRKCFDSSRDTFGGHRNVNHLNWINHISFKSRQLRKIEFNAMQTIIYFEPSQHCKVVRREQNLKSIYQNVANQMCNHELDFPYPIDESRFSIPTILLKIEISFYLIGDSNIEFFVVIASDLYKPKKNRHSHLTPKWHWKSFKCA